MFSVFIRHFPPRALFFYRALFGREKKALMRGMRWVSERPPNRDNGVFCVFVQFMCASRMCHLECHVHMICTLLYVEYHIS